VGFGAAWQLEVVSAAFEHYECDEVVDVSEAVAHSDGEFDLVVGRFDPGVREPEPDSVEDRLIWLSQNKSFDDCWSVWGFVWLL
jgi:hypothetical protein